MRPLWRSALSFCIFFVLFSMSASVLTASSEGVSTICWPDIERLIETHPGLKSVQRQVDVAEGEILVAKQYPNPEFGVSLGESREKNGSARSFIWDLQLSIPVEWPGAYILRQEAARQGSAASKQDAHSARLDVYRELRSLYLNIAYDQEVIGTISDSEDQLVKLAEIVRLRLEKGDVRPMEMARVEGELEELYLEKHKAISEAQARRDLLNLWLGGKLPSDFEVAPDWKSIPAMPELNDALTRAVASNPAVKAAQARKRQMSLQVSAEKHAAVPDLGVGAFIAEETDARNYGGVLNVSLPLWNWNSGGISRARAEQKQADSTADLVEKRVRESVITAHAKAQQAFDSIKRYREAILPKAEKTVADAEQLYRAGDVGLIDVLDARRALIRAQSGNASVLFDYLIATLELAILTGGKVHA